MTHSLTTRLTAIVLAAAIVSAAWLPTITLRSDSNGTAIAASVA